MWHYVLNDVQEGPVTREYLIELLRSGALSSDSDVWTEGMEGWLPARDVPELVWDPPPVPPPGSEAPEPNILRP